MPESYQSPVRLLVVSTLGVVSLVALWLAFELRYIYGIDEPTMLAMRRGFALAALGILLCWFVAPSRLLVGVLGLTALLFPLGVGLSDVPINLGFLPFVAFVVGLLAVTTHVRRRML